MITSSKEADFTAKEEGSGGKKSKAASSSSSTAWTRLKDPRIVRVSRAFGGKDRHSKVCTVRGLRDRRVRLSVPTAIQLYDLQDRLGLNQPSKAVDWLLEAAKDEIDELPPLQLPPGNFLQNYQSLLTNHGVIDASSQFSNKEALNKISNSVDWDNPLRNSDTTMRPDKSKVVGKEITDDLNEDWSRRNGAEREKEEANVLTNDFFPRSNHSSIPGFLHNVGQPYNSFYRWDPSNFSLSNGFAPQTEEVQNFNVVPLPPTLSLPTGSQVLVCPPGTAQSYFPPHALPFVELDQKQINHFQMLSSISSQNPLSNSLAPALYSTAGGGQSLKPLHLSIAPKLLHSENNSTSGSQPNTNGEFSLK